MSDELKITSEGNGATLYFSTALRSASMEWNEREMARGARSTRISVSALPTPPSINSV